MSKFGALLALGLSVTSVCREIGHTSLWQIDTPLDLSTLASMIAVKWLIIFSHLTCRYQRPECGMQEIFQVSEVCQPFAPSLQQNFKTEDHSDKISVVAAALLRTSDVTKFSVHICTKNCCAQIRLPDYRVKGHARLPVTIKTLPFTKHQPRHTCKSVSVVIELITLLCILTMTKAVVIK